VYLIRRKLAVILVVVALVAAIPAAAAPTRDGDGIKERIIKVIKQLRGLLPIKVLDDINVVPPKP
jgi:hypothetical protein